MTDADVAPSRDQTPVPLQVKEQACAEPDVEKDVARQDNNNELGGPVSSNEQDGAAPAEHDAATTTTPALHSASRTHHYIHSACRSQQSLLALVHCNGPAAAAAHGGLAGVMDCVRRARRRPVSAAAARDRSCCGHAAAHRRPGLAACVQLEEVQAPAEAAQDCER